MSNGKKFETSQVVKQLALPILLVLLVLFFSIMTPKFFTALNLRNILVQNVHAAVITLGVAVVMISGGVDLSLGYQMSTAAVIISMSMSLYHIPPLAAAIFGILICAAFSTVNGLLTLILKSHSMIITLGTMAIYQGVSYTISNARSFFNLPRSFIFLGQGSVAGIPLNFIVMIILFVLVALVMSKTFIGKFVYAAGDNPEAAWLSGVRVARVKVLAFTACGVLTGFAAVLLVARTGSGDSATGLGLEFTGITACVLGGVSLKGGEGKIWKVIVAIYVLGILANGMQLIGLGAYPQYIAKGIVMLLSIGLSNDAFRIAKKK
jgi:ribose/xylose/arabinose/galactoside ABC-type transport system permease subunit